MHPALNVQFSSFASTFSQLPLKDSFKSIFVTHPCYWIFSPLFNTKKVMTKTELRIGVAKKDSSLNSKVICPGAKFVKQTL